MVLSQGTNSQWDRPLPIQCTQPVTSRSLVIPVKLLSSSAPDPDNRIACCLAKSPGLLERNASNCPSQRHYEQPYRQIRRCSFGSQSGGGRQGTSDQLRLRIYVQSNSPPSERRSDKEDLASSATSSRISTDSQQTAKQPLKQLQQSTNAFGAKFKKGRCNSAHNGPFTEPNDSDEESPSIEYECRSPSHSDLEFTTGAAATADGATAATDATGAIPATIANFDASKAGGSWKAVPITGAVGADGSHSHGHSVSPANIVKGGMVYEHKVQPQTSHQYAQTTAVFGMGQDQLSRELRQSVLLAETLSRKRRQQRQQQQQQGQQWQQQQGRRSRRQQGQRGQSQQQGPANDVWPPTHLVGNRLLDKSYCDLHPPDQCRSPSPDIWPPQSLPWPGCRVRLTVKAGEATCQEMNRLKRSCQTLQMQLQQRPQQIYWPSAAFASGPGCCNSNNSNANNSSSHTRLAAYANIRAMYNWTRQMSSEILQKRLQRAIEYAQALDTNCSASSLEDSQPGQCNDHLYDSRGGSDLYSLTEKLRDVSPERGQNPEFSETDCDMCRRERMCIFRRSPSAHYGRRPRRRRKPRFGASILLQSNASLEPSYRDFDPEEAAALCNSHSGTVGSQLGGGGSSSGGGSSEIAELELAALANSQWQPQPPQQHQRQGQSSERGSSELAEIELAPLKDEKTLAAPDAKVILNQATDSPSCRTISSSSSNLMTEMELSPIEINSDSRRVRMGSSGEDNATSSTNDVSQTEVSTKPDAYYRPVVHPIRQSCRKPGSNLAEFEWSRDAGRGSSSSGSSRAQWGEGRIPGPTCSPNVTLPQAAFCLRGSLSGIAASSQRGCGAQSPSGSSSLLALERRRRMTRPMASEWRERHEEPDMPPRHLMNDDGVKSMMAVQAIPRLPVITARGMDSETSIVVDPPPMAFITHKRSAESLASSLLRSNRSSGQRKSQNTQTSPNDLNGYRSGVTELKNSSKGRAWGSGKDSGGEGGSSELQTPGSEGGPPDTWRDGERPALTKSSRDETQLEQKATKPVRPPRKPTVPPQKPAGDVIGTRGKTTVQVLTFRNANPTGQRGTNAPMRIRPPRFLSQQEERNAMYSKETGLLKVVLSRGNYSNSTEANEARQSVGTVSSASSSAESEDAAADEQSLQLRHIVDKAARLSFVTSAWH